MAIGDFYKLSIVGTFGLGQQFVNTLHYRQELITLGDPSETLANQFNDQVITGYSQIISANDVVNTIEVRQLTGSPLGAFDLAVDVQGSDAGDALPPQNAPLVSWRTGLVGRANRGRIYLPAPVEDTQTQGQLSTAYKAAAQNVADSMIEVGDLVSTFWQLVIFHQTSLTGTPVVSAIIRNDIATQRRRRVGTGS